MNLIEPNILLGSRGPYKLILFGEESNELTYFTPSSRLDFSNPPILLLIAAK